MKRIFVVLASTLVLTSASAHAEHKLLITDVLDARQVEAQAAFEYGHAQRSFTNDLGKPGRVTGNAVESRYSLGAGVGHGLEVYASLPYVFSEREKKQFNDPADPNEYEKRDGLGDLTLGAKYLLLGGEHAPVAVVAGVDVKLDSAGKNDAGSSTTDVTPYLAVSKNLGHHTSPYAVYRATVSNHGNPDNHQISVGLEKGLSEKLTLDARLDANFTVASKSVSSQENYRFELMAYAQVAHNLYLLPSIAIATGSAGHRKDTTETQESPVGLGGGVALYYLF